MPYDVKRFIFSVSLCAMLAANPVLATAPTNDEELGTTHDVYVESTLNQATNGIAGVSYVNRMVNAAGNAADAAEGHAAAAGAHALSAAQSADEAHKVLADKVNIDQGASNMAMVTDDKGTVYPGYITNDMIDDNAVTFEKFGAEKYQQPKNNAGSDGVVLTWSITGDNNMFGWRKINNAFIDDGAVTSDKIDNGAVTKDKIADGAVTRDKITAAAWSDSSGYVLDAAVGSVLTVSNKDGSVSWEKVKTAGIANGAVTIDKTAGVVGMVPVGSADATTYGQFWIE